MLAAGLAAALPALARADDDPRPRVVRVAPVAPDVLGVVIQTGRVERYRQEPYVERPGDRVEERQYKGELSSLALFRGGGHVGYVTGLDRDVVTYVDKFAGDDLDADAADDAATYSVQSDGDPNYAEPVRPTEVSRKAKANLFARAPARLGLLHNVYLRLPHPLKDGATYTIAFDGLNVDAPSIEYAHDPANTRSEAVHVNQHGFAPGDAVKRAYVSLWRGTGGGLAYGETLKFHVVDDATGERVHSGEAGVHWPADRPELMHREANHVQADVYRLDFPDLTRPGKYHVYVEGVGTSYPFKIAADTWKNAFATSVRGVFHHRSGIDLGPPHTDYRRPRDHHPDDGVRVRQSAATLADTSMGLNLTGRDSFEALAEDATDELVPQAWGGMHDAGDWDRRAQHLMIPRNYLKIYELFPEFVAGVDLNTPESGNDLPDVIDEALWILDFFKRVQTEDGGVRGGVESAQHPAAGDTSWTEIIQVYAYAPDPWASHEYAASAARAARVLGDLAPDRAAGYGETAKKAWDWAEEHYPAMVENAQERGRLGEARDARNLAALELYRLTGEASYHDAFLDDSVLTDEAKTLGGQDQRDAVFAYAILRDGLGDAKLRDLARRAVVADAEATVEFAGNNAFSFATPDRGRPPFMGFYSGPVDAAPLVRGHVLTGDDRYLKTALAATQFALGANPDNLCYTTGLGTKQPVWVLHEDSFKTGQPPPDGITVYGPFDMHAEFASDRTASWWFGQLNGFQDNRKMTPDYFEWPVLESYVDMWNWVSQNEYTPQQTMVPTAYVWGFLAAETAAGSPKGGDDAE